jgi:hypothetical protein
MQNWQLKAIGLNNFTFGNMFGTHFETIHLYECLKVILLLVGFQGIDTSL